MKRRTRPVAPQHASRASSMSTSVPSHPVLRAGELSLRRWCATLVPVIPEPMTTTSAEAGSSRVVRCAVRSGEGSECQKDLLGASLGRAQGGLLPAVEGLEKDILPSFPCVVFMFFVVWVSTGTDEWAGVCNEASTSAFPSSTLYV